MKNTKPTILITHPFLLQGFSTQTLEKVKVEIASTRSVLERLVEHADILVVRLTDRVDSALLARARQLKVLATFSVGVSHIDLNACEKRKIKVLHTPDALTEATSELSLALLLAASRRVLEGDEMCRKHAFKGWEPDLLLGNAIRGKTAVLVGKGRIGTHFGKILKFLGAKVVFVTTKTSPTAIQALLQKAQILSFHTDLTPETTHWLSAKRIDLLPRDCVVINTARGAVIDERALAHALKTKKIFAAGLDVFEEEPKIHPDLYRLRNVVLTPHLGSATIETRLAMARLACENAAMAFFGKSVKNILKPQLKIQRAVKK